MTFNKSKKKLKRIFFYTIKRNPIMIYETIPSKYLMRNDEMISDDFIKFINGDKYTPENHFVECVDMLAFWLNQMRDGILDCETSEQMRMSGHIMMHLQKALEYIYKCLSEYFSRDIYGNLMPKDFAKILFKKFLDTNHNYELHKHLRKILTEAGNKGPTYSSDIIVDYLNSPHVSKVLLHFGGKLNMTY